MRKSNINIVLVHTIGEQEKYRLDFEAIMKNSILILILALTSFGFAQTPEQQTYIDSVFQVSKNAPTDSLKGEAARQLGTFYWKKVRDFAKASEFLFQALEIADVHDYPILKANCYSALSWIEDRKENHLKALEYMVLACDIFKTSSKSTHIFKADYNLGGMYANAGQFDKAEIHLINALEKAIQFDNNNWIYNSYMALGEFYHDIGEDEKSLENFLKSADKIYETHKTFGNGRIPYNIAELYAEKGDFINAEIWINRSLECVNRRQDNLLFKEYYYSNFKVKKMQGRAEKALQSYEKFTSYKDSIFSQESLKASQEAENKYLNDLKQLEQEKQSAEKKLNESEKQRAKQKATWLTIIIILVMIALVITFFRFKATREKNKIIEKQKTLVEEKNKEITDSINYAKRIQAAILPAPKVVKECLTDSFILYKPKDIVAGDFYWLEQKEEGVLFAAADCTGHGVPGAMVSVVCNNALNRAVREYNLTKPCEILDKTREIVCEEFVKSEEERVSDGMDIALCSFTRANGKPQLQFAGAHNPLWIVRKGKDGLPFIQEIKGDRQPVGHFDSPTPFKNHEIDLQEGDHIYIFSDGFADQFGGDDERKFNRKNFKELFISVQNQTMEEQKNSLNKVFENWRGELDQIDDVCVIGIKIT